MKTDQQSIVLSGVSFNAMIRFAAGILAAFFLIIISATAVIAQGKNILIEFNEKGQMISSPAPSITTNDHIMFKVNTTLAFREGRILNTYKLFQQNLNLLNKRTNDNRYIVAESMGIVEEKQNITIDLIGVYSRALVRSMIRYLDEHNTVLNKYFNVDQEKAIISGYLPETNLLLPKKKYLDTLDGKYKKYIKIPDLEKICFPDFYIVPHITNVNGLDIKSQCNDPFTLEKCVGECDVTYTRRFDFKDISDGPVRLDFELRMNNNVFDQLIAQMSPNKENDKSLLEQNFSSMKAAYLNVLEFTSPRLKLPNQVRKQLTTYIKARENTADGKISMNMSLQVSGLPRVNLTTKQIENIDSLMHRDFEDVINRIQSPEAILRLLELSWLSGGQKITANPIIWDESIESDAQLAKNNQLIKSLQYDSVDLVQQISLLNNVSKAANSVAGFKDLASKYEDLLSRKKNNEANLQKLHEANKKAKTPNADPFIAETKKNFSISDSLFYKGFFYVNFQRPEKGKRLWNWSPDYRDKFYHPNLLNYAFMRNHNALEDYELKGKQPVRGINETQRLFIIVDNATEKSKIIAKTIYNEIKLADDHDSFDLEHNNNFSTLLTQTDSFTAGSLDKLFDHYERIQLLKGKVFSPYRNGILTTPLPKIVDQTPDYVSKLIAHQGPFKAPSSVSYQLIDSMTNKNLSAEGNTYTYRFNKLYRFRIKAGIVYSWLQNRNYSINATNNTATYTNSYTGLAPSVGIQIFTTRLDIQSTRIFPHGASPFVYLGYLYSGTPAANILLGGGWEVFSGVAITGGLHLGRSQSLTLVSGTLQEKDVYKGAAFLSLNIGLEAFNAIFNTAKPTVNPFK